MSDRGPAMSPAPLTTVQVGLSWQLTRPSGLNRTFFELTRRLAAESVKVHGLVVGGDEVAVQSQGLVRAFAPAERAIWRRVLAVRRAARAIVAADPQAILVSHFAPYGLGLLGKGLSDRRPLVVHFHGPWSGESQAEGHGPLSVVLRRTLEGRVYRRAVACIVMSRAFGNVLSEQFGVPRDRITLIPGGAGLEQFVGLPSREEARDALGWELDAPTVLSVRRLVKRTGVDRLIDAVPALRARVPGVRVMIIGDGAERGRLEARMRELGVEREVRFVGRISETSLPLAYRAANLTVVPSVALEGFGLIVPESLAAGTPPLVTPVGGLPETVDELSRDLILRDSTAAAIADGLAEALSGARVLPDAERCSAFARAHYDWQAMVHRVAALYRSVM